MVSRILVSVVSSFAFTLGASAADLSGDEGWDGFYVGASVGKTNSDAVWTTTNVHDFSNIVVLDSTSVRNFDPASFSGDVFAGRNWEVSENWVAGFEADIGYGGDVQTTIGIPGCTIGCIAGAPGPGTQESSVGFGWDGSARMRLGYVLTPDLLFYATGGASLLEVQSTAKCQHAGPDPSCGSAPGLPFSEVTQRSLHLGYTVGAGFEHKLASDWSLRAEYRFSDYGKWSNHSDLSGPWPVGSDTLDYDLNMRTHAVNIGVAHSF